MRQEINLIVEIKTKSIQKYEEKVLSDIYKVNPYLFSLKRFYQQDIKEIIKKTKHRRLNIQILQIQ